MMMMKNSNQPNETYLAEWLAGTISDAQLKLMVNKLDYSAYIQLRDSIGSLQLSDPDMEENYSKIRKKIDLGKKHKRSGKFYLLPSFSVAAAILVLLGLFHLLAFSNSENTGIGTKSSVKLPDNSTVTLNAQSTLDYPTLFKYNRKIKLSGEAFFDVEKGSTFCVETENGTIEVLGTKFNVLSRDGFFEVICYEGRVKVAAGDKTIFLDKGHGVRFNDNKLEKVNERNNLQPLWISGESSFKNVPFHVLIEQLKSQYDYSVKFPKTLSDIKFSGTFSNSNLEMALRSICLPLNLQYNITKDGTIIISE